MKIRGKPTNQDAVVLYLSLFIFGNDWDKGWLVCFFFFKNIWLNMPMPFSFSTDETKIAEGQWAITISEISHSNNLSGWTNFDREIFTFVF